MWNSTQDSRWGNIRNLLNKYKTHFLFWAILVLGLLRIYSPVIQSGIQPGPFLQHDDPRAIMVVADITSLHQYWEKVRNGQIPDLQPIRDLSFWLNFKLSSISPNKEGGNWAAFQFINVLIWFGIAVVYFQLLLRLNISKKVAALIVLLYSLNPLFISTIVWVSARRYLLSTFFTLLLTWLWVDRIKKKKDKAPAILTSFRIFKMNLIYILAILSAPINILWPFFAIIFVIFNQPHLLQRFKLQLLAFFWTWSGLMGAIMNYRYYKGGSYLIYSTGRTQIADPQSNPKMSLFLLFTFLAIFLFIVFKLKLRNTIPWIVLCFLSFFPVIVFQALTLVPTSGLSEYHYLFMVGIATLVALTLFAERIRRQFLNLY